MTALAYNFTKDQDNFLFVNFICQPTFKIYVARFYRPLGCQSTIKLHFAGSVSKQGDMQKCSF